MDENRRMIADDGTLDRLLKQYGEKHGERSVFDGSDGDEQRSSDYWAVPQAVARMMRLDNLVESFRNWLDDRDDREARLEEACNSEDPCVAYEARVYGRLPGDWKNENEE